MQRLLPLLEPPPSTSESLAGKANISTVSWLIDSGASHHMIGNIALFSAIHDIAPTSVGLPDSMQTSTVEEGMVLLHPGFLLRNVLVIPHLSVNLLFVGQLINDSNCTITFALHMCAIQDRSTKNLIGLGKPHKGVFLFRPLLVATAAAVTTLESYSLWLQRLGYPSRQKLLHLPGVNVNFPKDNNLCDVCCRAKQTRFQFLISCTHAKECFELIHCDIWRPYRVCTLS